MSKSTRTATAAAQVAAASNAKPLNGAKPVEATPAEDKAVFDHLAQAVKGDLNKLWGHLSFKPESVQGAFIKFIARIVLYATGFVCALYVTSYLSMLALAFGWPVFLVAILEIVSLICGMVGSWMASDKIVNYVADGNVSRDIKRAGGWIKARFSSVTTGVKSRMAMH